MKPGREELTCLWRVSSNNKTLDTLLLYRFKRGSRSKTGGRPSFRQRNQDTPTSKFLSPPDPRHAGFPLFVYFGKP
jgi:hypothetical protein